MERSRGRPEIKVALIDGPVVLDQPDFADEHVVKILDHDATCSNNASLACVHGTFVAGILHAKRGSVAPAICPDCTLLVRPVFLEDAGDRDKVPIASPEELASAIVETIDAGAKVLNMSLGLTHALPKHERQLQEALDYAAQRGALCVVAAGNQGTIGSSAITRHPWAIPVIACTVSGKPMDISNLGTSIGRNGLSAPGENITSLGTDGKPSSLTGTSAATPFVAGTAALLWSEFPNASAAKIKLALTNGRGQPRNAIVPPLLNAAAAYKALSQTT
jgi:subtilisin family serine protease